MSTMEDSKLLIVLFEGVEHWSLNSVFGLGMKLFLCVVSWLTTEVRGSMNKYKWWWGGFPCSLPRKMLCGPLSLPQAL